MSYEKHLSFIFSSEIAMKQMDLVKNIELYCQVLGLERMIKQDPSISAII